MRRHEKPGSTKCDKCSEVFEDYGSFCNHRITTHGEWQPYRCKGCNQGLEILNSLFFWYLNILIIFLYFRYQSEQQLEKHLNQCKVALNMRSMISLDVSVEDVETSNFDEYFLFF